MNLLPRTSEFSATEVAAPSEEGARFDALVREYGHLLRSAVSRFCPRNLGLLTADIEQEAAIRVWRAIRGEREIENPASYFYRVAATATIDAVRQVKRRREEQLRLDEEAGGGATLLPADTERSPETLFRRREIVEKVQAALSKLPENRRRAVGLYLQGMTTEEIGRLSGWTEAKARNLTYRGLADLRHDLKATGIDLETE
jgi:RNA polymerase sigma-70 factor (ECF subfamily)